VLGADEAHDFAPSPHQPHEPKGDRRRHLVQP
jgi:hypothetical protein